MPSTVTITVPKLAEIRKALAAGVAAAVPLAISDALGSHWAQADILGLVGAFVAAVLGVYGIRNGAKPVEAPKV